jgi:hypothetical protein
MLVIIQWGGGETTHPSIYEHMYRKMDLVEIWYLEALLKFIKLTLGPYLIIKITTLQCVCRHSSVNIQLIKKCFRLNLCHQEFLHLHIMNCFCDDHQIMM